MTAPPPLLNLPPTVRSVNVGRPRDVTWLGRPMRTSIGKRAVDGAVEVLDDGLVGDEQSDPDHHGGADKAVYAYAVEDYDWWHGELGRPVPPASFGENLTVAGLDLSRSVVGERWRVGSAVLEVSEPRTPCWKLGMVMGDARFPRAFCAARRPGVLLRVVVRGHVRADDSIVVEHVPGHGVTVSKVFAMYVGDPVDVDAVLAAPGLAAHWQDWRRHRTVWHLDEEQGRASEDAQRRATT